MRINSVRAHAMQPKKVKKRYQKLDQITHMLERSDMYVGSKKLRQIEEFVVRDDSRIERTAIVSSPAVLRIFVEALSNAVDNVERSRATKTKCTTIRVSIDPVSSETSIWNDGDVVPIEKDDDHDCYNHSLIFGQLLTGSNYDDEEERRVSGRNGIGIKACNVFSTKFTVEGVDPVTRRSFRQTWRNNMKETDGPVVSDECDDAGYTCVSWVPDFTQFEVPGYTEDIVCLYKRYVVDAAMLTKIDVYLNDELIPIADLPTYAGLYSPLTNEILHIQTKTTEVVLVPATEHQVISFVNGVYTRLGGQHVDAWTEALFRPIVGKVNKKNRPQVNIKDVRQFFRLFVVTSIDRPEFDGQDKNKLESPAVTAEVQDKHIKAVMKWSVIKDIEDIIASKEDIASRKAERKTKFVKVEGHYAANHSGGKLSTECTLILCEGLSARSYAIAGIETGVYDKAGRDWFGVYALRGKVLNTRNATLTESYKNAVISDLIKAIGLSRDKDYRNDADFRTLRYGKIMVLADADCDGIHIEGLLINFVHSLFPTLFHRVEPFVISMKTPIARVFRKGRDLLFYDERKFKEFASQQDRPFKSKYYKGLGTTRTEDVPDTFGQKMIRYEIDPQTDFNINKAFLRSQADDRKAWVEHYDPALGISLDDQEQTTVMNISDYVNTELIKFSYDNCSRSIPCGIDGLKQSQRKILFAVKKRNLKYSGESLKVAQFGGYVAEHSEYHHGEQNLYDTITNMAGNYVGSNNIPLLYPDGQFGTRESGGKNAAQARYIFTKAEYMTQFIFPDADDVVLDYIMEDGTEVEPEFYVPIIPMALVNGCACGIGTGWSCTIPCFNPLDLVNSIREWLAAKGNAVSRDPDTGRLISLLPEIHPWYRGFEGTIERVSETKYVSKGICTHENKRTAVVTELPVGMWTDKFKKVCDDYLETKDFKDLKDYSTTEKVHVIITENPDSFECNVETLKLSTSLALTNMVLINHRKQIVKYHTVDEIIDDFCKVRFEFYTKRKTHMIVSLERELRFIGNKERFISEVVNKTFKIMDRKEVDIVADLDERKYTRFKSGDKNDAVETFEYLLRLQVRTFTREKIQTLRDDIASHQKRLETIRDTSERKMWLLDLTVFEKEYAKWLRRLETDKARPAKKKTKL